MSSLAGLRDAGCCHAGDGEGGGEGEQPQLGQERAGQRRRPAPAQRPQGVGRDTGRLTG